MKNVSWPKLKVESCWDSARRGDLIHTVHRIPRAENFMPNPNDPELQAMSLENYRKTIREDTKECVIHQVLSTPEHRVIAWGETPWVGESQFRIRERRARTDSPIAASAAPVAPAGTTTVPGLDTNAGSLSRNDRRDV